MKSDFIIALTQLAAERNLPREIVLSAIEAALASAYKRDSIAAGQNISVKLDPGSGDVSVFVVKTVVEQVEDSQFELTLSDARKIEGDAQIGDVVRTESLPHSAGRIAAQTAKQVVMQRLREAERDLVFKEFSDKEGEVFTVTVQKIEPRQVTVEMGRAEAVLPHSEQPMYERYRVGQKVKVLLQSIRQSNEGPEIIVSRADKLLLRRLFEMEVPEIYSGSVEIVDIAREAGSRSKVAVFAKQEGVDAVGSCVGLRGIRIQNIVNELHGEKIDVVPWAKDSKAYISRALSPSQVMASHARRGGGDGNRRRAREPALAGHWQGGPERPACGKAHQLEGRDQEQRRDGRARESRRPGRGGGPGSRPQPNLRKSQRLRSPRSKSRPLRRPKSSRR